MAAPSASPWRRTPSDPWLFFRDGWDWRWLSFAEAARQAAGVAAALPPLPPGEAVAFADGRGPASLVVDAALQAAALTSAPVAAASAEERGCAAAARGAAAWVVAPGEAPPPGLRPLVVPHLAEVGRRGAAAAGPLEVLLDPPAGSGVVVAAPGGHRRLAAAELAAAGAALAARAGGAGGREIALFARPLEDPLGRLLLAWSLAAGAALVLEPDGAAFAASAAWVRPTLLAGDGEDLRRLWRHPGAEGRGRRSPLGRLRSWLLPPGAAPGEAEASFCQERGILLLSAELPAGAPVVPREVV
jgi:hypothetical protein